MILHFRLIPFPTSVYGTLILIFLSCPSNVSAQNTWELAPLQEDLKLLKEALQEGHAGLHIFNRKETLEQFWQIVDRKLDQVASEADFYRLLSPVIAQIRDAHTELVPSQAYLDELDEKEAYLPFKLKFIEQKAYIWRDYSDQKLLKKGTQLLSINQRSLETILQVFMLNLPGDGANKTYKYHNLENTQYFGIMHNLLFGSHSEYALEIIPPGDSIPQKIMLKGKSLAELGQIFSTRYPQDAQDQAPIQCQIDAEKSQAYLKITSFNQWLFEAYEMDFSDFLKKNIREMNRKNIQHLVIDLRDNEGGTDEYGKILLAHLMDTSFYYYQSLELKNKEFSFLPKTDIPDERIPSYMVQENKKGTFDFTQHVNLDLQAPAEEVFRAKVYVLMNGGSFSSTSEFLSLTHFYQRALFIGEESGSNYYGNTSGFMPLLTLPYSKIRIRIPLMRYHLMVKNYPYSDRGLIPDHSVQTSLEDLVEGRDTVLDFVHALIQE